MLGSPQVNTFLFPLTTLVQPVIRILQNSLCLHERIHHRTHEYKWGLLKVREEKYKGKHAGAQVESGGQESMFLPFR
jgi:hypothetical protein